MISFITSFWWLFIIIGIVLLLGLLGYIFMNESVNTIPNEVVNNNIPVNNQDIPVMVNTTNVTVKEDIPVVVNTTPDNIPEVTPIVATPTPVVVPDATPVMVTQNPANFAPDNTPVVIPEPVSNPNVVNPNDIKVNIE